MANLFQASEIVNIGIEDEVSGGAMYQALAEKTENATLTAFYEAMVAEKPKPKAPPAMPPGGGMGDMDY